MADHAINAVSTRFRDTRETKGQGGKWLLATFTFREEVESIDMNKLAVLEQKTDAEIALAIHYLDPECAAKRTEEDAGTILGISVTFLTFLAGVVTYICLYVRSL